MAVFINWLATSTTLLQGVTFSNCNISGNLVLFSFPGGAPSPVIMDIAVLNSKFNIQGVNQYILLDLNVIAIPMLKNITINDNYFDVGVGIGDLLNLNPSLYGIQMDYFTFQRNTLIGNIKIVTFRIQGVTNFSTVTDNVFFNVGSTPYHYLFEFVGSGSVLNSQI